MLNGCREGRARILRRIATLAVTVAAALVPAAPASAAQRHASPTSIDVLGSCTELLPCRLDHAVNGAAAGDEVIVE